MQTVAVEEIEPTALGGEDVDRRGLSDPLGTTDVAVNYYALDPGEAFSGGMHAHLDQEEVFYVVSGTATFETKPDATADSETVEVTAGEAIRFAPGEFQQGRNEGDEQLFALALGAPRESTEGRVPQPCSACGESDVLAVVMTDDGMGLECPECGAAFDAGG
jgi:mannose-6-phosphate isomerase-like protein (cupin superfamily)